MKTYAITITYENSEENEGYETRTITTKQIADNVLDSIAQCLIKIPEVKNKYIINLIIIEFPL